MQIKMFFAAATMSMVLMNNSVQARSSLSIPSFSKTKITLERGECLGDCPIYKVEIFGDGRVLFSSDYRHGGFYDSNRKKFAYPSGVLLPGIHEDHISPKFVSKLVSDFRKAKFFALRKLYAAPTTDLPTYRLTFEFGLHKKTVIDYGGLAVGMPKSVSQLEDAVDRAAGTDRWVQGTPSLITWLERQKFDFHSVEAGQLAAASANGGSEEGLTLELIDKGAPLDASYEVDKEFTRQGEEPIDKMEVAQAILEGALKHTKLRLFNRIARSENFKRLDKAKAARVFGENAAACSPSLVDTVAAAGIDIDAPWPETPNSNVDYTISRTALSEVASTYGYCYGHEGDRNRTIMRLLAHGANPNHRNSKNQTPIFSVINGSSLKILIDAGADVSAIDKDGHNALFWTYHDEPAFVLIEKGLSPAGINEYCQTMLDLAKERNMPRFAKWLRRHPDSWKSKPETMKPCTPPKF